MSMKGDSKFVNISTTQRDLLSFIGTRKIQLFLVKGAFFSLANFILLMATDGGFVALKIPTEKNKQCRN